MKVRFTDGRTLGVCEDEVILMDGRRAAISFGFKWDEDSQSFPRITDGELKDSFGVIGRFSKFGNLGDWKLFDKDFRKDVSKILSDTLAILKINLTNGAVSRGY